MSTKGTKIESTVTNIDIIDDSFIENIILNSGNQVHEENDKTYKCTDKQELLELTFHYETEAEISTIGTNTTTGESEIKENVCPE